MKVNIGIKEKDTAIVADLLNKLLADLNVLYIKVRNAHWNVEGADFHAQHVFFEEIYGELESTIDDVAERARSIGHYAVGSLGEFLKLTQLSEEKPSKNDSKSYIKIILNDYESIIITLRKNIEIADKQGDAASEDFLVGILGGFEKTAWMLRSHLA